LDSKLWTGLLVFLLVIGNGIVIIRRGRKSKKVQSYGHPVEDAFLLISSALVLIGLMFLMSLFLSARLPHEGSLEKYSTIFFIVVLGAGLAYASKRILRHRLRGELETKNSRLT
jgi:hypothetical protein